MGGTDNKKVRSKQQDSKREQGHNDTDVSTENSKVTVSRCRDMIVEIYLNNNNESIYIAPWFQVTLFKGAVTSQKNSKKLKVLK